LSAPSRIRVRVPADLLEYIPELLTVTRAQLASGFEELAGGSFAAFQTLGHNLKGSAAAFGLDALGDLGRVIEDAARARDGARVTALAADVRDYLDRLDVVAE
jgi:HPt (histidine-containing phosphotransfer) domain-containing protein